MKRGKVASYCLVTRRYESKITVTQSTESRYETRCDSNIQITSSVWGEYFLPTMLLYFQVIKEQEIRCVTEPMYTMAYKSC